MDYDGRPPALARDGLMPGMDTAEEMEQQNQATGRELDLLFCRLMIRHHEGGLIMIHAVLAGDRAPAVRALAQRMKNTQQTEMDALEAIRDRLE